VNEEKELPEGWIWTKIGEIAETTSGGTPSRKHPEYYQGNIPWIKSGELNDKFILVAEEPISEEGLRNSSAKIFPRDTLLIAMYGATIGKTGILGIDAATNQAICAILPFNNIFTPKFALYWLQSQRQNLIKQGFGGAQPNINQGVIYNLSFPLSPLPEQQRIVSAIEERFTILDAVATALRQNKQKLKLARVSVLKHAVEGKLTEKWRAEHPATESGSDLLERILAERRAKWETEQLAKGKDPRKLRYEEPAGPDVSGLSELPREWCWVTFAQVASSQNGRSFPSSEYTNRGVKLLRPGNLFADGMVKWTEANTKCMPEIWAERNPDLIVRGTELVINLTAQSLKDEFLGRVCITSEGEYCLLNQRIARITPLGEINRIYTLYMLKSSTFRRFVDSLNTGSLIQHMFTSQLVDFRFPLPPLAEQEQIVAEVERRLSVIEQAEAAIETSLKRIERARQSILERAFSGRLVPQDPHDEPASVLLERIQEERGKRLAEGKLRGKNGGVKATRGKKTKEQDFVPQWQLLKDAKQSGSIDGLLSDVGAHEDGAAEKSEGKMDKEELEDLVQMPLLSLWD